MTDIKKAREFWYEMLRDTNKDSTVKPRAYFLASVANNLTDLIKNRDQIMERINRSTNPGTRWKNLMHIMSVLELNDMPKTVYNDVKQEMYDAMLANQRDNTKTKRQLERFKPLPELQAIILDRLKKEPLSTPLMAVACYVLQPALRNDWFDMGVTKSCDARSGNWICKRGKNFTIVMNEYKNSFTFGHREIKVTDELSPWLSKWLNTGGERKKVFTGYTDNAFGKMLSRASKVYFGQPLTINDFRHIWEIHFQTDPRYAVMSMKEKDALHAKLLHTTEAAMLYNVV
jgi:hypothetical protein